MKNQQQQLDAQADEIETLKGMLNSQLGQTNRTSIADKDCKKEFESLQTETMVNSKSAKVDVTLPDAQLHCLTAGLKFHPGIVLKLSCLARFLSGCGGQDCLYEDGRDCKEGPGLVSGTDRVFTAYLPPIAVVGQPRPVCHKSPTLRQREKRRSDLLHNLVPYHSGGVKMLVRGISVLTVLLVSLAVSTANAAEFIYPAKGQSPEQQQKDEAECYSWAVQQSGYDPALPPTQPPAVKPSTTKTGTAPGAGLRGAARGALVGELVGDDAGAGAAAGAVAARGQSRRQYAATEQQAQQQQQAASLQQQEAFGKARAACLEGRGYTVK